jgi:hypothetical protein
VGRYEEDGRGSLPRDFSAEETCYDCSSPTENSDNFRQRANADASSRKLEADAQPRRCRRPPTSLHRSRRPTPRPAGLAHPARFRAARQPDQGPIRQARYASPATRRTSSVSFGTPPAHLRAGESDRFISKRRKHFFVGEQPLVCIIHHQHRLAAAESEGGYFITSRRRAYRDSGQPNLEAAAYPRRC